MENKNLETLLGLSKSEYINKVKDLDSTYCRDMVDEAIDELKNSRDDYNMVDYVTALNHLNSLRSVVNKTTKSTTSFDDRSTVTEERGEDGKIKFYHYEILVKDKEPIVGVFNREEMSYIHRMYTYYGASLTQRQVSRMFPEISLADFRKILTAFSITKASSPFPKHMLEEFSNEELREIQLRQKEGDLLNTLDKNEIQDLKKTAQSLAKQLKDANDLKDVVSEAIQGLDLSDIKANGNEIGYGVVDGDNEQHTVIIWLSDMHIGARVDNTSIYQNSYDADEVERRLAVIYREIERMNSKISIDKIFIVNLGDSLDGMDGYTVSRTHQLPQNMNNKEQLNTFIRVMTSFITRVHSNIATTEYLSVGESNHDGDFGYAANIALCAVLDAMDIDAEVSSKFYLEFNVNKRLYVCCHGKDNKDMNRGFPLLLNTTVENKINEYLDSQYYFPDVNPNITFVKGDQHQHAITHGRRFKYHSLPSLFGSSEWIHKNFGNTPWGSVVTIVDQDGTEMDKLITENK